MNITEALHIVRNPEDYCAATRKEARLMVADEYEKLKVETGQKLQALKEPGDSTLITYGWMDEHYHVSSAPRRNYTIELVRRAAAQSQIERLTADRDQWKREAMEGGNAEFLRGELATMRAERDALAIEHAALEEKVAELKKLAYVGDHHFPDLTYKARYEETTRELAALKSVSWIDNRSGAQLEPVCFVKENNFCPEGTSDEISEYLPAGTKLFTHPAPADKDGERYRWLRDPENQHSEDDPCVSDSFFNVFTGKELDDEIDKLIERNAAIAKEKNNE